MCPGWVLGEPAILCGVCAGCQFSPVTSPEVTKRAWAAVPHDAGTHKSSPQPRPISSPAVLGGRPGDDLCASAHHEESGLPPSAAGDRPERPRRHEKSPPGGGLAAGSMSAYLTSRRGEPVKSWRGRPILYSGSASISLSWAIQPTVRARAKMPVNRLTGMPMARCTMPE